MSGAFTGARTFVGELLSPSVGVGSFKAGVDADAAGDNSIAIGSTAYASGEDDVAIGMEAYTEPAAFYEQVAIGGWSYASGNLAIAVGGDSVADGENSVAVGGAANGAGAVALGDAGVYAGPQGIAIGSLTVVRCTDGIAIGRSTYAGGTGLPVPDVPRCLAIGTDAESRGTDSIALGTLANARGLQSIAIGPSSDTDTAVGGVAIGYATVANQDTAIALGYVSKAYAQSAIAIGNNAQVQIGATSGAAIGPGANVSHANAVAIGKNATSSATNRLTVGNHGFDQMEAEFTDNVGIGVAPGTLPLTVLGVNGSGAATFTTEDTSEFSTDVVANVAYLQHVNPAQSAVDGFGVGLMFQTKDISDVWANSLAIYSERAGADNTHRAVIQTYNAGVGVQAAIIDPNGHFGIGVDPGGTYQLAAGGENNGPAGMAVNNASTGTIARAEFIGRNNNSEGWELQVYGTGVTGSGWGETLASAIVFRDRAAAPVSKMMFVTSGTAPIHFVTDDTKRMTIGSDGNVAIGADPGGLPLFVKGTTNCAALQQESSITNTAPNILYLQHVTDQASVDGFGAGLMFQTKDSSDVWANSLAIYSERAGADNTHRAVIQTYNAGSGVQAAIIDPDGDIEVIRELVAGAGISEFGSTPPSSQPTAIADVTGTAGASYTSTEQTMIDDLKTQLNAVLAVLRARGTIAT